MNLLNRASNSKLNYILIGLVFGLGVVQMTNAQSTIEFLGAPGAGGPNVDGPITSDQVATFYCTPSEATAITATFSLDNQQFSSIEGNPSTPGVTFGGSSNSGVNDNSTNIPNPAPTYQNHFDDSGNGSTTWMACDGCPVGSINNIDNYSIRIAAWSEALINSSGTSSYALDSKNIHYGDLTITFNQPVSNPVLHLDNLGGVVWYTVDYAGDGNDTRYIQGMSGELELMTSGLSMSLLSGKNLQIIGNTVSNNASYFYVNLDGFYFDQSATAKQRFAASGSVLITGENITELKFRVLLDGDGGELRNFTLNTIGIANNGNEVKWAFQEFFFPGNASFYYSGAQGDQFLVGLSFKKPVKISGNVFLDPDGGDVNNSSGGANMVPSGMYANLIDKDGNVIMSVPVNTDGTYEFPSVFESSSASGYSMVLSTTQGTQGSAAPTAGLPSGYVGTGEYNGTPDTGNDGDQNGVSQNFIVGTTDVTNINFGIEQPPVANNVSDPAAANPGGTNQVQVPTLDYSDPEDGTPNIITIETLPDPATEGLLYYNGILVTVGQEITNYDPTLLTVDPIDGLVTVDFTYSATDSAGETSPPATATIAFTSILPIKLISFEAYQSEYDIHLSWKTVSEVNNDRFELEYCTDGTSFSKIGKVKGGGNSNVTQAYAFIHSGVVLQGNPLAYYRLKQIDFDGKSDYSVIRRVLLNGDERQEFAYFPNPVRDQISITGEVANDRYRLQIRDVTGKIVYTNVYSSGMIVNIENLQSGIYLTMILDNESRIIDRHKIIKL